MSNQTGWRITKNIRQEVIDGADYCDHVTADDLSKAVGYSYESDSFGLVAALICCEPCRERFQAAEAEVPTTCHDCGQKHPRKEVTAWKWYDFYAPQGDEPIEVCNGCWTLEKHQQRLARDVEDYNNEHGIDDADEDDDDDIDEDDERQED